MTSLPGWWFVRIINWLLCWTVPIITKWFKSLGTNGSQYNLLLQYYKNVAVEDMPCRPGSHSQYQDHLSKYRDFHYWDKTVARLPYLHDRNFYTDKMASIFWNGPRICIHLSHVIACPYRQLWEPSQIARFMGPTWDPPGAYSTQVGPMLAQWTLLSGLFGLPKSVSWSGVLVFSVISLTLILIKDQFWIINKKVLWNKILSRWSPILYKKRCTLKWHLGFNVCLLKANQIIS